MICIPIWGFVVMFVSFIAGGVVVGKLLFESDCKCDDNKCDGGCCG